MQCTFVAKNNNIPTKRELSLFFKCKNFLAGKKLSPFVLAVNLILPFGCCSITVKFVIDLIQQLILRI